MNGSGVDERHCRKETAAVAIALFALALGVYTLDAPAHLNGQGGDTLPAQLLPLSVLAEGDLDFDEFAEARSYPNAFVEVGGRTLSGYPVLPGLLNVPVYAVARVAGLTVCPGSAPLLSLWTGALLTAGSVSAVFVVLRRRGVPSAWAAALCTVYAFGTTAYSVASRGIWQHGPALLFLAGGLSFLVSDPPRRPFTAGLLLGLSVITRPPVLLLVLPLFLTPLRAGLHAFARFALGFLVPALCMRLYAASYFGSPVAIVEYPVGTSVGFLGPHPVEGVLGVLFSPGRGLFVYTPFALLGALGAVKAVRERDAIGMQVLAGLLAYVLLAGTWQVWWGGKSWGYRIITEILPGLFLLAAAPAIAWARAGGARRAALAATICASFLVSFVGARYYPRIESRGLEQDRKAAWSLSDNELVACLHALGASVGRRLGPPGRGRRGE